MRKKNTPEWLTAIYALVVVMVVYKLYLLYKAGKDTGAKIVADITGSTQVATVKEAINKAGITDVRAQAVQDAAEDIYAAFYKDSFFGFGEDEPKAIDALNGLKSISEAKAAAGIYRANFKKSMYSDFVKYCNGSNFKNIKTSFLTATKGI